MFEFMLMELEIIWPGNNFVGRTMLQCYSSASVSVTVGSVEVLDIGPRLCVRLVRGEMPTISAPISSEVHDVR